MQGPSQHQILSKTNPLLHHHNFLKMAAFIKAINTKIRSHPVLNYVCSTRKFTTQFLPQLRNSVYWGLEMLHPVADRVC
jgi:hypothetical protein